jgi:hypothetical protein
MTPKKHLIYWTFRIRMENISKKTSENFKVAQDA